ncbi:MAG: SdpI family protein [Clostridiaceae bacterium]|nr:SdpI family protein [Clostridiaceae bacterium]MBW4861064.1 SdpI family protein [Clostridiaceae bacterium]MBW4867689.1 SdpI family protein [Clostridiaceae bacterium]
MKMYIFLIIMNSLIPITMLGFGALWKKYPPQSINWVYGYRTKMSMKSKETWGFAHAYHAKVWFYSGIILLTVSLIVMLLFRKNYEKIFTWIIYIQLAVMMLSIIPTEIALRKRFDKNGNLKK